MGIRGHGVHLTAPPTVLAEHALGDQLFADPVNRFLGKAVFSHLAGFHDLLPRLPCVRKPKSRSGV